MSFKASWREFTVVAFIAVFDMVFYDKHFYVLGFDWEKAAYRPLFTLANTLQWSLGIETAFIISSNKFHVKWHPQGIPKPSVSNHNLFSRFQS